jgi:hypothetical protein
MVVKETFQKVAAKNFKCEVRIAVWKGNLEGYKKITQRFQVFVSKCLRKICVIFYPELIINISYFDETGANCQ